MITPLTSQHLDALWAIEQSAHAFPWTKTLLAEQLAAKGTQFGLWQQDQLIAFAIIQCTFPEAELLNIAVAKKYQGKNFGRQLLEFLLTELISKKYQRCYLEVRASNHIAIHLYESLGFNQIGTRKNYYPGAKTREDALVYGKELCF